MTVFSSLRAAVLHGFHWYEYQEALDLHVVVRDHDRGDGRRVRMLAFARPDAVEDAA